MAYSYGWNLLFIAKNPKSVRLTRGTPRQLNCRIITCKVDFPVVIFISPRVLVQTEAVSVPRVGHTAKGKPGCCLPGSSVKKALLAEGMAKMRASLMICISNPGGSGLCLETSTVAARWCLLQRRWQASLLQSHLSD